MFKVSLYILFLINKQNGQSDQPSIENILKRYFWNNNQDAPTHLTELKITEPIST